MYHLRENKTIILDSYLYFKYSFKLKENISLNRDKNQNIYLSQSNDLFLICDFYLNGYKLEKQGLYRVYQYIPEVRENLLETLSSRIKETKLNIDKIKKELDTEGNKEKLYQCIEAINTYLEKNPDKGLLINYLRNPLIKANIWKKLSDICKSIKDTKELENYE